tara:strand:- start:86 stop:313 length:228 start_codon:yes stop_codon:yes gene_type:complete
MSVASAIYNETCHICEVVGKTFKKSLKKIQYGLQMSANRRVARELAHLGFHQQKEYNQILDQLNDKTNAEYHSRY